MTLNEQTILVLQAFEHDQAPAGGMVHFEALRALDLDGTPESLHRLDAFLLQLHAAGFAESTDLDAEEVQNFLYFVAFYLGKVAGQNVDVVPNWCTWDALMEANPFLKEKIPLVFGTSVLCTLNETLYIPLSAVLARLCEGEQSGKSVWHSVHSIVANVRG